MFQFAVIVLLIAILIAIVVEGWDVTEKIETALNDHFNDFYDRNPDNDDSEIASEIVAIEVKDPLTREMVEEAFKNQTTGFPVIEIKPQLPSPISDYITVVYKTPE